MSNVEARDATEHVGIVKAICRYPVKSMGGENLTSATVGRSGIDGDRQYAFHRGASGSPSAWLTGRELPALVTYSARYVDAGHPGRSFARVHGPDGDWTVSDPALLDRLTRAVGDEVGLLQSGRGAFDCMPISVLSTATLDLVDARFGRRIDGRRFRANILIETGGGSAGRETGWVGRSLAFGDRPDAAIVRADAPIDRCGMITIDPDSGARDPAILRRVVEDFGNQIGLYCAVVAPGTIAVGDAVRLLRRQGIHGETGRPGDPAE